MHPSKSAPRLERQLLDGRHPFCSLPHITTPLRLHVLQQQLNTTKWCMSGVRSLSRSPRAENSSQFSKAVTQDHASYTRADSNPCIGHEASAPSKVAGGGASHRKKYSGNRTCCIAQPHSASFVRPSGFESQKNLHAMWCMRGRQGQSVCPPGP